MKIHNSLPSKETVIQKPHRENMETLKNILNQEVKDKENSGVSLENSQENIKKAIKPLNEFLEIENRSMNFVLHEGLDEYYVQIVNTKSKEVIREIPSKKLLDAFYTMQKFIGMIVDEKI